VKVLLDIDADFMVGNADGHDLGEIQITGREYGKQLKYFRRKNTEVHLMIDHHESLYYWDQAGVRNAMCIHIDAHHDMWEVPDVHEPIVEEHLVDFQDPRRGLRTYDQVDCGNYLHQAMIDGIVGQTIYVPAPFRKVTHERADIAYELRSSYRQNLIKKVRVKSWEAFKRSRERFPKADIITIAISPEWTPRRFWPEIADLCRELGVSDSILRTKKKKAIRKWKSDSCPGRINQQFDYKFPYQARIV
jgi:hypothetical protein